MAKKREDITADDILAKYSYDPVTGVFTYARDVGKKKAGDVVNTTSPGMYIVLSVCGYTVQAHRAAWLLTHGKWPDGLMDHINRDRQDNRIANLREADHKLNAENTGNIGMGKYFTARGKTYLVHGEGEDRYVVQDGRNVSLKGLLGDRFGMSVKEMRQMEYDRYLQSVERDKEMNWVYAKNWDSNKAAQVQLFQPGGMIKKVRTTKYAGAHLVVLKMYWRAKSRPDSPVYPTYPWNDDLLPDIMKVVDMNLDCDFPKELVPISEKLQALVDNWHERC
ncbi:p57.1 [Xanthomonas phage Xop411]|uniref:p57.1 n=1 Tax=Xanthomonas phage Xop411 TaxID=2913975 RepID=A5H1J8_9CAUD|nr:p57.1 [Xanthomonas phage Xop411]ABK00202.2 p57.1 [Xanthomonas phage Xop411]